ncbi:MAG TPA: hypothetical protein VJ044_15615, partial [Candidatus Hodarchaeales archaeon]|nr:hypothetical protein [Candidatus Hodarchaeales archaeon]
MKTILSTVISLTEQLDTFETTIESKQLEPIERKIGEINSTFASMTNDFKSKRDFEDVLSALGTLKEELSQIQTSIGHAPSSDEIVALREENLRLSLRLRSLEGQAGTAQEDSGLKEQLGLLQSKLVHAENDYRELKERSSERSRSLEEQILFLSDQNTSLQSKITENESGTTKATQATVEVIADDRSNQIEKLKVENTSLHQQVQRLMKIVSDIR